ncbi:DUF4135 domain-containing protein, partial [Pseudomonas sp. CCI1.2]
MQYAIEILKLQSQDVKSITTDCPVWPYLVFFTKKSIEGLTKIEGLAEPEKKVIINGYLRNLSTRITNTAANVLTVEKDILNSTIKPHKLNTVEYYNLVRNNSNYLLNILEAYPELDRVLQQVSENFVDQTRLLATRLSEDRAFLEALIGEQSSYPISECNPSEGETHNGSLTVCSLTFSNGSKVIYKPRNLTIEHNASMLLKRLSEDAGTSYAEWEIPSYIVNQDHGWAQFVPHTPASNILDVHTYYKRAGFLLGFCTAFTASDITSDNIICNGSNPTPIDLETMFYCVLDIKTIPKEVRWNCAQTSILPNWTWKGTDGIGVDLSALGGLREQYVSLNLYQYIEDDSGDGTFGTDGVKIFPAENVLYIDGEVVSPWLYEQEIREGFNKFFSVLEKNKLFVVQKIQSFKGLPSRYVPRPTATYHYALQCSLHASLMRSTNEREAFLAKILDNDNAPAKGFLPAEVKALLNLDIPYAKSQVGSLDFFEPHYSGEGHLDPNTYLDGLSNSVDYIENFSESRRNFELAQINNTLTAMKFMYDHDKKLTTHNFREVDAINLNSLSLPDVIESIRRSQHENIKFLTTKISTELSNNGLWYGFHASPGGYIEYSELGEDLYYGLSGIIYGLVTIHHMTPIPTDGLLPLLNETYRRVVAKLDNQGSHLG